jgi:hypothetical protein
MRIWLAVIAVLATVVVLLWASDKITLEGERTVYTARCQDGAWQGAHCGGRLVAAERYRFRALKPHGEVVFWTVGASAPSGKFADCEITDGRNWTCKPNAEAARTITLQMAKGVPVADASGRTKGFHAIEKWRWVLLKWGVPVGSTADA